MTKDAGILDLVSKDTQSITSSKSNKSADKTAPSLFDSMLQEANTSKNTTEKDISSTKSQPQNSKEEQKLDTKTKDEATVESKKDESPKLENSKLDNQKQENQTNIDQNNNETKSKNQAQSSLLDRLVHEAKVQIQKESIQSQIKDTENNKIITKEIIVKEVTTIDTKNNNIVQTQISTATTKVTSKDDLDLLNQDKKQQNQNSLMDRLLEEAKSLNTNLTHDIEADETTQKIPSQAVVNNIYLSSLNKATTDAMLGYVHEAKTLVSNATSIKDVQKGADLLNLGLQDSEVTVEDSEFNQNVKNDFLNKLSISKDIVNYDAMKISHALNQQSKETISSPVNSLSSFSSTTDIDITVPSNLAFNIENRIIGAQQQMNSMMSDIARNMYLNYKPPITAFRMHLNPGQLGSISVLMRSDKDSGLSISLNMSNAATLDSFVDNQATLRAALAKNFNTTENINLEFNMQDGQGNNQEQQNKKNNNKSNENHQATTDILENINQEVEISQKAANYM